VINFESIKWEKFYSMGNESIAVGGFTDFITNMTVTGIISQSSTKMLPCMNVGTMKYYEVIGNIHDNSELLQK
jgi:hypothetical protein